MKLVLATRNPCKVAELCAILLPLLPGAQTLGAEAFDAPEPVEDEVTFAGNALIRARQLAEVTGLLSLADDSDIYVDVMGGASGMFSARWCGKHGDDAVNLELLLAQTVDVPERRRGAPFVCAVAVTAPDGREEVAEGVMRGSLLSAPRGESGFGHDPIFRPEGLSASSAELTPERKGMISHHGKAFWALAVRI